MNSTNGRDVAHQQTAGAITVIVMATTVFTATLAYALGAFIEWAISMPFQIYRTREKARAACRA